MKMERVWKKGEYQKLHEDNYRANIAKLYELGLMGPEKERLFGRGPIIRRPRRPREKIVYDENSLVGRVKLRKRSDRHTGEGSSCSISVEQRRTAEKHENVFGAIPDVPVGTVFASRIECSHAGVHRPTVAGIHGSEQKGCYSLALSGGYEDDVDVGESFTYTGQGGRDLRGTKNKPKNLRTAPQTKDQTLSLGNLALTKNIENLIPVRVVRGFKLQSPYAPTKGYRYDGLYTVEKYWTAKGKAGHQVYKYALTRCGNQAAAPWDIDDENEEEAEIKLENTGASSSN